MTSKNRRLGWIVRSSRERRGGPAAAGRTEEASLGGAGERVTSSMGRGIVDGKVGCLEAACGRCDCWRASRSMGGGKVNAIDAWGMQRIAQLGCSMEMVSWLLWGVQLR